MDGKGQGREGRREGRNGGWGGQGREGRSIWAPPSPLETSSGSAPASCNCDTDPDHLLEKVEDDECHDHALAAEDDRRGHGRVGYQLHDQHIRCRYHTGSGRYLGHQPAIPSIERVNLNRFLTAYKFPLCVNVCNAFRVYFLFLFVGFVYICVYCIRKITVFLVRSDTSAGNRLSVSK